MNNNTQTNYPIDSHAYTPASAFIVTEHQACTTASSQTLPIDKQNILDTNNTSTDISMNNLTASAHPPA